MLENVDEYLAGAATVVEHGDHGGTAGEVVEGGSAGGGRAEEGGSNGSSSAGLHDLAAVSREGHGGRERGGGAGEGEHSAGLGDSGHSAHKETNTDLGTRNPQHLVLSDRPKQQQCAVMPNISAHHLHAQGLVVTTTQCPSPSHCEP